MAPMHILFRSLCCRRRGCRCLQCKQGRGKTRKKERRTSPVRRVGVLLSQISLHTPLFTLPGAAAFFPPHTHSHSHALSPSFLSLPLSSFTSPVCSTAEGVVRPQSRSSLEPACLRLEQPAASSSSPEAESPFVVEQERSFPAADKSSKDSHMRTSDLSLLRLLPFLLSLSLTLSVCVSMCVCLCFSLSSVAYLASKALLTDRENVLQENYSVRA